MKKVISLNETIYELSRRYSDIVEILHALGFSEIVKPGMINSVGRFVTLKQGASLRKIDLDKVVAKLKQKGFTFKEEER